MATFITRLPDSDDGVRLAVKDLIDVAGVPATGGSRALAATAAAAERDALCLAGARAAGARIVGKAKRLGLSPTAIERRSHTIMGSVHERSLKPLPNWRDRSRALVLIVVTATTTVLGLRGRGCSDPGRVISPTTPSLSNDFRQYAFLDMRSGNWKSRSVRRKI